MNDLNELRDVIQKLHGAIAFHVKSVPIKEIFKGKTVWEGIVEVFDLEGHPRTNRAYAWSQQTEGNSKRHVTVLHIPPVVSPETAVKASIVQEHRHAH